MRRFVLGVVAASTLACESTRPAVVSLRVDQQDVVVTQGETDTVPVTVTRSGASADVHLSASQLPAGVTAAFVPVAVSDATHLLLLTAAVDATPGSATVVVETVSGGARDTTSINIHVRVRGSFWIAISDTVLVADVGTPARRVGTTAPVKLAINRLFGFWQPVTLSVKLVQKSYEASAPADVVPTLIPGSHPDSATISFSTGSWNSFEREVDIIGTTPGLDPVIQRVRLHFVPPISLWPDTSALFPGMTRQLSARSYFRGESGPYGGISALNHVERSAETWTTNNPAVVTVSPTGVITAVGPGAATIYARLNGFEGAAVVSVLPSPGTLRFVQVSGRSRYPFNGDDSGELVTNPHTGVRPMARGCGVTTDQRLFCWGVPYAFQDDTYFDRCEILRYVSPFGYELMRSRCGEVPRELFPPVRFKSLAPLEPLAVGSCAITTASHVNCWGENRYGQLGIGTTDTLTRGLTGIATSDRFVQVSSYGNFRCALREDGAVYCWGSSRSFAVANPTRLGGTTTFVQLSERGLCALAADSTAYCWNLAFGGTSAAPVAPTPVQVSVEKYVDLTEVSGGHCGLAASGQAKCWTTNDWSTSLGTPTAPEGAPTFAVLESGWGITAGGDRYSFAAGPWRAIAGTLTGFPTGFKFRTLSQTCGIGTDALAYCWSATFHKLRGQD